MSRCKFDLHRVRLAGKPPFKRNDIYIKAPADDVTDVFLLRLFFFKKRQKSDAGKPSRVCVCVCVCDTARTAQGRTAECVIFTDYYDKLAGDRGRTLRGDRKRRFLFTVYRTQFMRIYTFAISDVPIDVTTRRGLRKTCLNSS